MGNSRTPRRRPGKAERAVPLPLTAANDDGASPTSVRGNRGRSGARRATESAALVRPVRYAVLGLGHIAQVAILPAFAQAQVAPENFRSSRKLGGGPLHDIGIYCINAARAAFAAEPTQVLATAVTRRDQRFKEVPETVSVVMKFPQDRIASFTCSFGGADRSAYEIVSPELSQRRRRPTLRQEIRRPGIQPPPLVGGVHSATI